MKKVSRIPSTEGLYLQGDFNTRVGADHMTWPTCIGSFRSGNMNDNGQRLLELCCFWGLCVTNTYFKCKEMHQVSWRHPRSKHWHQLDLVITRRTDLASIFLTRSYHSADCNTDHALTASRVRVTPKQLHHSKKKGHLRINSCCASNPEKTQQFINKLEENFQRNTCRWHHRHQMAAPPWCCVHLCHWLLWKERAEECRLVWVSLGGNGTCNWSKKESLPSLQSQTKPQHT